MTHVLKRRNRFTGIGRALAAIGVVGLLVVVLVTATGAQSGDPRDVNSLADSSDEVPLQPPPVIFPEPPEGFLWTANGELVPADAVGMPSADPQSGTGVFAPAAGSGRHFYLTDANHFSDTAKTACASGYHMASMWEIIDPSNMIYDYNHPAAHNKDDSGQGPPSGWYGRVRTGRDSSNSSTAGMGNCNNWTSASGSDYGLFVRLSHTWETPPAEIGGIWEVTVFVCSTTGPVWCVED